MKATRIGTALVVAAIISPGAAQAAATCQDAYYVCLNNSYSTKGLERFLADFECGVRYVGCLRKQA
jgi:hypothetical protein